MEEENDVLTAEEQSTLDAAVEQSVSRALSGDAFRRILDGQLESMVRRIQAGEAGVPESVKSMLNGDAATSGGMINAPYFYLKSSNVNPYESLTDDFRALGFARACRIKAAAMLENRSIDDVADEFLKKVGGQYGKSVNQFLKASRGLKSMNESTIEDGGALLTTTYGEFIQMLRSSAIVRQSGVVQLPLPGGSISMRRQTQAGTAYYVGETPSGDKTSKQKYGMEQVNATKIIAATVLSNDLIRDAGPEADRLTRDDLIAVTSLRSDLAFIRDDGTQNKPKGILYWTDAGNKFDANATINFTNVGLDLEKARYLIRKNEVPMIGIVWYISPRTETYLRGLRDTNGNLIYYNEMIGGKLMGYPYYVSTQIPDDLGTGSNESEIYLVATQQHIIFDNMMFEIDAYRGAAYVGPGGVVQSGLSNDETVIQLIGRHNFFQRHPYAAAVIQKVKWGA